MKALSVKWCRDSDSERQAGDVALNAKLKKKKALNPKLKGDGGYER